MSQRLLSSTVRSPGHCLRVSRADQVPAVICAHIEGLVLHGHAFRVFVIKTSPGSRLGAQEPSRGKLRLLIAFSRPARKDATNQNLLRQNFIAYIFGSQEGKRPAPSPKNESPFNYIFRSQSSGARALLFTSLGSERAQGAQSQREERK